MSGNRRSESHPLSDAEVKRIATVRQGDTKVVLYPHPAKYETIDDVFGTGNKVIILYVNSADEGTVSGHWVGISRESPSSDVINYTDPYGKPPDEMLKDYPQSWKQESGQDEPLLTRLFREWCEEEPSQRKITYSDARLQKSSANIQTCGRWSAFRLRHSDVPEDQFERTLKAAARERGISTDELITAVTNGLLS